ncbi:MAG: hypothetical protein IJW92_05305 [Clostridia bacterium]|nr:hypothetical protein [Clostridia bacterium]
MKTCNSHLYETEYLKRHTPSMRYDRSIPFVEWKRQAHAKLLELLGLPLETCDPCLEIEDPNLLENGVTEYRFGVQTEPGYFVPCHLLIPQSSAPVPLTVCLSGHGGGMHVALGRAKTEQDRKALAEWPHRAMALRAIREGRAALVIEARNFGESSVEGYGTSCTEAAKMALLMGRTVIGERVWDAMRILDAVQERFEGIDFSDTVCTGNSGGGTATYYLACVDERITAAMPSCSICSYETSIAAMPHCLCNHIPSIRKYFEMSDLAGLIAPRTLVIAAGREDAIFPIEGTEQTFAQIKRMYEAAGAPKQCALVVGDGGHLNYADHLWKKLYEIKGL